MTQDDKSAPPEDIVPALFPALAGMTAHLGRTPTKAVASCTGAPSVRRADASSPPATQAIAVDPIGNAGSLGRTHPAETQFREHHCLPGCCAGRHGVAADPQRRPQGRPRNSGCAPRLLSSRQLTRSVHQPRRTKCGRDDQRDPHIDRPPGHPRGPGPYAASPVGCGLACVPRRPLPPESRPARRGSRARCGCAARPFPAGYALPPVRTTFREVTNV